MSNLTRYRPLFMKAYKSNVRCCCKSNVRAISAGNEREEKEGKGHSTAMLC